MLDSQVLSILISLYIHTRMIYYIECPETVTAFQGSPGEVIEGRVEPALVGVMVRLDLGSDGHVTTHTNESGYYRLVLL